MKERINEILGVLGSLAWRGFGIFLFVLGGAAGTGAIVAGSWIDGILVAWGTLMLGVISAIGYAVAVTGKVDKDIIAKASQDAIQKAQADTEK